MVCVYVVLQPATGATLQGVLPSEATPHTAHCQLHTAPRAHA